MAIFSRRRSATAWTACSCSSLASSLLCRSRRTSPRPPFIEVTVNVVGTERCAVAKLSVVDCCPSVLVPSLPYAVACRARLRRITRRMINNATTITATPPAPAIAAPAISPVSLCCVVVELLSPDADVELGGLDVMVSSAGVPAPPEGDVTTVELSAL